MVINHLLPGMILQVHGGWTNPCEKYAREIGFISPIFRVKIQKNIWVATT